MWDLPHDCRVLYSAFNGGGGDPVPPKLALDSHCVILIEPTLLDGPHAHK